MSRVSEKIPLECSGLTFPSMRFSSMLFPLPFSPLITYKPFFFSERESMW